MDKGQPPPYIANATTYSHPQAVYNQYPQGNTTVVFAPQVIPRYGPTPQPTTCPHCHMAITTRIEAVSTSRTHIAAILFCFICCLPCVPYCTNSCKNKNHYCPNCSAYLGSYDCDGRMGRPDKRSKMDRTTS